MLKVEDERNISAATYPYDSPFGEIGNDMFQAGSMKYPMSWVVSWFRDENRKDVVLADPEIQGKLGLPVKKAIEDRKLFEEATMKERKDKKRIRANIDEATYGKRLEDGTDDQQ